jgi:hypothetical protein
MLKIFFEILYSVMRCYPRKLGEKTFLYSKEKEGISLTKKYPHNVSFAKKLQKPKHHPQHPSTYVGNKLQKPKTSKLLGNCSMSTCYRSSSSSSREINKASSAAAGQKT